jgi:hypothetical protein
MRRSFNRTPYIRRVVQTLPHAGQAGGLRA